MTVTRANPAAELRLIDGRWWVEHVTDDPDWIVLGWAPRPHGRWSTLRYHVLHGLLMGYPVWRVLRWSWRNSDRP